MLSTEKLFIVKEKKQEKEKEKLKEKEKENNSLDNNNNKDKINISPKKSNFRENIFCCLFNFVLHIIYLSYTKKDFLKPIKNYHVA